MTPRAIAALFLAMVVAVVAPTATRAATPPGTPTGLEATGTIEGVRLTWEAPAWAPGQS